MIRPGLIYHTARNLSPAQTLAWVRNRVRGPGGFSVPDGAPPERSEHWGLVGETLLELGPGDPGLRIQRAERTATERYRFLNRELHLPRVDWTAKYESALWTYQLHYFDFATDVAWAALGTGDVRYTDAFSRLWTSWLDAVESGAVSIEPYPTSVRSINALRSLLLLGDRVPTSLRDRLLWTTHAQLAWLESTLEVHLRANHLLKNLNALAWDGLVFSGKNASLRRGRLQGLWAEVDEQVLTDGGHFERSPMYHAAVLSDLLEILALCRTADTPVPDWVPGRLDRMTRALQLMTRLDGTLHLFNDAANGECPAPLEVMGLARQVLGAEFPQPAGHFALRETGYHGWIDPTGGGRIIIDAGPPGPSYQPGHAHCDMLSFELDLAGRQVVVDAGVHGYDGDPYREYVRSTRAHNTVSIGNREQHEVWGTFRMARRGDVLEADSSARDGTFEFRGACRHYYDRSAVHRREIRLEADTLTVTDFVEGAIGALVTGWLHLHPDFAVERAGDLWLAQGGDLRLRIDVFGADEVEVRRGETKPVQGWHCPEFGLAADAPVLAMRLHSNRGEPFGYRLERV